MLELGRQNTANRAGTAATQSKSAPLLDKATQPHNLADFVAPHIRRPLETKERGLDLIYMFDLLK